MKKQQTKTPAVPAAPVAQRAPNPSATGKPTPPEKIAEYNAKKDRRVGRGGKDEAPAPV